MSQNLNSVLPSELFICSVLLLFIYSIFLNQAWGHLLVITASQEAEVDEKFKVILGGRTSSSLAYLRCFLYSKQMIMSL